jgi:antirestriction protein ArdC
MTKTEIKQGRFIMNTQKGSGTATLERPTVAASGSRADAYQQVTDQVIAMLEAGTAPWHQPWNTETGLPRSLSTGKPYRGINLVLLQVSAIAAGYSSPWWATYDQIQKRGGQVRRDQRSTLITFWKQYTRKARTPDEEDHTAYVLRTYRVFNTDQADGLVLPPVAGRTIEFDPITECDEAIARYFATGPRLVHGGSRACYVPSTDVVMMPERSSFERPEAYYGTLFHESTHSTGHHKRLARPDLLEFHTFGDPSYSREELVAEMGAAFLSGHTGITAVTLPNSANYLASWLQVLKSNSKLVIQAAAQAQKAADLILGITHTD